MIKIPLISNNKAGFRLSQVDILMILFTGVIAYIYPPNLNNPNNMDNLLNYLIPYVVFNFFLFCNVFRVRTKYELCWLFSATINVLCCLLYYENISVFFITQFVCTVIAIVFEIKSDKYHGIFCKKNL